MHLTHTTGKGAAVTLHFSAFFLSPALSRFLKTPQIRPGKVPQAPAAESMDRERLGRASVPEGVHMGLKIRVLAGEFSQPSSERLVFAQFCHR